MAMLTSAMAAVDQARMGWRARKWSEEFDIHIVSLMFLFSLSLQILFSCPTRCDCSMLPVTKLIVRHAFV